MTCRDSELGIPAWTCTCCLGRHLYDDLCGCIEAKIAVSNNLRDFLCIFLVFFHFHHTNLQGKFISIFLQLRFFPKIILLHNSRLLLLPELQAQCKKKTIASKASEKKRIFQPREYFPLSRFLRMESRRRIKFPAWNLSPPPGIKAGSQQILGNVTMSI